MPVSAALLIEKLGIDPPTADFFVQRRMPGNNEYWSRQTHFVSVSTGYIFIPVFFDLLIKEGLAAEKILAEDRLLTMENILQSAGRMEYKKVSMAQHIADCRSVLMKTGLSEENIDAAERMLVHRPFTKVPTRFASLRRANTFLYVFADDQAHYGLIFKSWELLLPLLLMLDDFADLEQDHAAGEENCLLDDGRVTDNFFELVRCAESMLDELSKINKLLADYLRKLKDEAVARNLLTIMGKV
jgi:hypothetical protein